MKKVIWSFIIEVEMQKLDEVKLEILVVFKLETYSLLVTWFIYKWRAIMLWSELCDYHVRKGGDICEYVIVCSYDGCGIISNPR